MKQVHCGKEHIYATRHPEKQWLGTGKGIIGPHFAEELQKEARPKACAFAIDWKVEVLTHGVNGNIREKDSYENNPYPPKG